MRTIRISDSTRRGPRRAVCCVLAALPFPAAVFAQESIEATEIGPPAELAPEPEQTPLMRPEAEIAIQELLLEEDYSGAVPVADRLLELTLEQHGTRSSETGNALNRLGDVQRRAGLYEEAELSFLNAIEVFRAVDGPFAASIVAPSIGLGDTYYDDEQYVNALAAYNEARTLQRRSFGLLSTEQIDVMDKLTNTYQSMAMYEDADEQQRNALLLVERVHGPSDVETLEAIYKYAMWLRSVYRYDDERAQYERAIRIVRSEYGKDHPLLVRPYSLMGNSYRRQGVENPRGISSLNSAVELIEAQEDATTLELAEAIIDVADWKTAFGPPGSGHEEYLRVWNMLGSAPDGEAARKRLLQNTLSNAVRITTMSVRGLAQDPNDPNARDGSVLIQFDVNPWGRSENVAIVQSDPPGFKDDAAARSIRLTRFRPRMEDGEFVYARRQGYQITFQYIPDEGD